METCNTFYQTGHQKRQEIVSVDKENLIYEIVEIIKQRYEGAPVTKNLSLLVQSDIDQMLSLYDLENIIGYRLIGFDNSDTYEPTNIHFYLK